MAFKVTRPKTHGKLSCTYSDWTAIESEFDGAEFGESITVELVDLTPEQVAELPDFEGW
jgi:hypothetical protein